MNTITHRSIGRTGSSARGVALLVALAAVAGCASPAQEAMATAHTTVAAAGRLGREPVASRGRELIARANGAFAAGHIVAPPGENALELFLQVRHDAPDGTRAEEAFADIFPYAVDAVRAAMRRSDRAEAARILALLQQAMPGSLAVSDLDAELRTGAVHPETAQAALRGGARNHSATP